MMLACVFVLSALMTTAQENPAPPAAQEKPPAAPQNQATGPVQLKVTVVLSRYQGDKRVTSLPYVFGVSTGQARTNLRMGSDVPVILRAQKAGEAPAPSFNYRSVGTNIDCSASMPTNALYSLSLVIEDSSVELPPGRKPGSPAVLDDVPSFRSFRSSFTTTLRDGQSTQHTSATDPVTGEVTKIDVTVNVLK